MENREIQFRAWDIKYKEMVFNIQIPHGPPQPYFFSYYLDNKGFEVMQYTGLKDKNDKEIYEGDIIEFDFEYYMSSQGAPRTARGIDFVEYRKSGFYVADVFIEYLPKRRNEYSKYLLLNHIDNIEIIGNIYEHPELIKQPNEA